MNAFALTVISNMRHHMGVELVATYPRSQARAQATKSWVGPGNDANYHLYNQHFSFQSSLTHVSVKSWVDEYCQQILAAD